MNKLFALLLLCLWAGLANAQNPHKLKGMVADTSANAKLYMASISLLNSKDSTLVKFTRADVEGHFELKQLKAGNYILRVSYPEYADYVRHFQFEADKPEINFGNISLIQKASLLKEIIIKGEKAAIKINGDTTEFNASSYTIQPNDRVEDLIKKFPGIQVDQNGKITAQGKAVQKVLLDGEEFFGDDPTLLTKNIRADMIDKVQLYEKKSDQAELTGIDDGNAQQTLNFILKENQKKGSFGKLNVGSGSKEFNSWEGMLNRFDNKKKFAAYAVGGNTGKVGLSWSDQEKYSGGIGGDIEYMEGGGIVISITGDYDEMDSFEGTYSGTGLPNAKTGGLHFSNKWAKDKYTTNFNYKIGQLGNNTIGLTNTQRNLPTGSILSDQNRTNLRDNFRHKLDGMMNIKLDSLSNIKFNFNGSMSDGDTDNQFSTESQRLDFTKLNSENRRLTSESEGKSFNFSALYSKRFTKKGRTFSAKIFENFKSTDANGFLRSQNSFYDEFGNLSSNEITDQRKVTSTEDLDLGASFTYNEPISKTLTSILSYGFTYKTAEANRNSFNKDANGNYNVLDNVFSNNFRTQSIVNNAGLRLNYTKDKLTVNSGLTAINLNFDQEDLYNNVNYKRDFININPNASLRYKFNTSKSIAISYNGFTQQPTIGQLQPVRVNDDVLNIPIGNPDLKPAFRNGISINYNSYKMISGTNLYGFLDYSFTNNAIVSNAVTEISTGKTTTQSINLDGKSPVSIWANLGYSKRIKSLGNLNLSTGMGANANTYYSVVNGDINKTDQSSVGPQFGFSKYTEKKYDISFNYSPRWVKSVSSLNSAINNNGYSHSIYANLAVYLPGKIKWSADLNQNYTAKTQAFDNDFRRTIINSYIEKGFFDKNQLTVTLSANDLLNQNNGFSRNASSLFISQTYNNTISQYFLLSMKWEFSKMGVTAK